MATVVGSAAGRCRVQQRSGVVVDGAGRAPGTITQVLANPPKRTGRPVIEFLTAAEVDALLDAPDPTTRTGRRDHDLLATTVQTGLRISEVCSLMLDDVHLGTGAHVTCTGKGRRQRITPLTSATASVMTAYLAERTTRPGTALGCGPSRQPLSRDALEHRLTTHLAVGVDVAVIAMWLDHANTYSTDAYLHADMLAWLTAL